MSYWPRAGLMTQYSPLLSDDDFMSDDSCFDIGIASQQELNRECNTAGAKCMWLNCYPLEHNCMPHPCVLKPTESLNHERGAHALHISKIHSHFMQGTWLPIGQQAKG